MTKMKDIYGKCGCNCGHCPAFEPNIKSDEDKKKTAAGWGKYFGINFNKHDWIICKGCQSPDPWKTGNQLPDRGCYIRPCAVYNEVKTCAHCTRFACEELIGRMPDETFRANIEKRLGEKVPEKDYLLYVKPYEAVKNARDAHQKLKSKDMTEPKAVKPIRARIAKFPDKLAIPKKEADALRKIHGLIERVMTADAPTYARRDLIKRRRHHILGWLWEMSLHGKIAGNRVVLENKGFEDRWMVRKRDTTPHTFIKQGFAILKPLGIIGEFEKVGKKDWRMTVSFEKKAGGTDALKALQKYVKALVKKHGKPVYAGSTRFKGEAMVRFLKADMSIFAEGK